MGMSSITRDGEEKGKAPVTEHAACAGAGRKRSRLARWPLLDGEVFETKRELEPVVPFDG